jgi:non-homologous end joining protein Ku
MRTVLIRAHGKGLIATTLNFDYEVRSSAKAFEDMPDLKIEGEMLDLAEHIIGTKKGSFDASTFDDRYEAGRRRTGEGQDRRPFAAEEEGASGLQAQRPSAGAARKRRSWVQRNAPKRTAANANKGAGRGKAAKRAKSKPAGANSAAPADRRITMAIRPYWKGYLKLSLVTCPVQMMPATSESEKVRFHTLNRQTQNRVVSHYVDSVTGKEVKDEDEVKGYQRGEDEYIILEDEELENVALDSTKTIDISTFTPRDSIEWIWLDTPYYLSPTIRSVRRPSRSSATRWRRRTWSAFPGWSSPVASAPSCSSHAARVSFSGLCAMVTRCGTKNLFRGHWR